MGGMANMSKLVGKKMDFSPLPDDASDELKAERLDMIRQINGVPESAEGYGVQYPDGFPEEMQNSERLGNYLKVLHEHNAPPSLVNALIQMDAQEAQAMHEASSQEFDRQISEEDARLRKEWGNSYEAKLDLAERGAKTLGIDTDSPVFKSAEVKLAMSNLINIIGESKMVSGDSSGNLGMPDREKALSIVNDKSNPLHAAYHDANHPQHQQAIETHSRFNQRYHELKRKGRA